MYAIQRVSHVSIEFKVSDDPIAMIEEPKLFFKFKVDECRKPVLWIGPWLTTLEMEDHRPLLRSFSTTLMSEKLNSFVLEMLSSIEILQSDHHENLQKLIIDQVCDEASIMDPKTMDVIVDIKLDTIDVYEEGDEEISNFIRELMVMEQESERMDMRPTSRDAIEALEKVVFEKGGGLLQTSCVVCIDEFFEGMEVKMMPCSHIFHGDCIDQWLGESGVLCVALRCQFE
ncbi:E3 ubiquitin-protein ligase SDIR1-like [Macadamia integrifolia]|uniref:E3 ubiquitin-protein ligase SDIR1-like n=1 Tax=Macadamia integrifolia TaxID=60698 RepID=UPI001C53112E|nr:E3 ubiquitin-protein ligase SDIR1-like [Macadamia integrifolia]